MVRGGRLVVALEDPSARNVLDEIEFSAQCKVLPVLARAGTLAAAIERVYARLGQERIEPGDELRALGVPESDGGDSADKLVASLEQQPGDGADDGPVIEQSDNSLVRLINTMILEARQQGVSDIHVECPPSPQKVQVRFRRDGVLRPYIELPPSYRQAIVARIKIMCDLDIAERRKPQDGKIAFGRFVQGQRLELRVATIPTANNLEDVVLRLLASARTLPLEGMGLQPDTLARFKSVVERPYGMVLCVGPTGSGKTTTLHAALAHLNTPDRKIWTAEDPVEITQHGLRQVQINPRIDWTFAKALRAFLRADPDVVMVGEIRDRDTAQMAIEASLTGHLVLSTLHTNSAPETVTRLLDMGMDPFSFADSLLAVLAQRLVRRWCKHCVASGVASPEVEAMLLDEYVHAWPDPAQRPPREVLLVEWRERFGQDGRLLQHHANGCRHCNQSGFAGRVGLHELLMVSREMRRLIQTNARAEQLQHLAMAEGMRTLRQDGILKVLAGLTSIEEVRATSNS
jgi:type II secretory ATPase GspE/PulE/Tfp pilus assembly ATPase PilB-like protein